jgi:hypothetical protein
VHWSRGVLEKWGIGHLWHAYEKLIIIRDEHGHPAVVHAVFIDRLMTATSRMEVTSARLAGE